MHVSSGASGHDRSDCGASTTPCARVQYALDKAVDGDRILLDTNYEFVFKQNLRIDKNVIITSYTSPPKLGNTNEYATIVFLNTKLPSDGLVNLSCNFTATNINFTIRCTNQVRFVCLFRMYRYFGTIRMHNCLIHLHLDFWNYLSILSTGGFKWKFDFQNTKFTAAPSIYTTGSKIPGRSL